jgi:anti-sigma factor RsiW
MMEHLTEEQLNEYLDNSLEAAELARMGAHLS